MKRALAAVALVALVGCDRFDRSFGGDGTVTLDVQTTAVVASGDGIVILGTSSGQPALVRYDADGARDEGFGDGGRAPVRGYSLASVGMAPDGAGGFVVAGIDGDDGEGFAVARYDPVGAVVSVTKHAGSIEPADVAVDGAGTAAVVNRMSMHTALVGADGSVRIVETRVGHFGTLAAVVVQPDGRFVVAGQTAPSVGALRDLVLVRYHPDGRVDTSFAWQGASLVDLGGDDVAQDLAVAPDGGLVLSAHSSLASRTRQWVVRFTASGALDHTFDGDGRSQAPIDAHSEGRSVHVRPDGRVVTAGLVLAGEQSDLLTTQWTADGRPDQGWGDGGANRTDLGGWEQLYGGVLLADGRLLAAGADVLVRYVAP